MSRVQAAVVVLVTLILAPGLQFYFDVTPKAVVLLAGTAVVLLWQACRPDPTPASDMQRLFAIVLLCNALSVIVSSIFSRHPALSWFGANWRRFGAVEECAVLAFAWSIARYNAGRPDGIRTLLRGIAVAGIIASAYGIAQYFGWDPILPKSAYHVGEGVLTIVRPPGTLGYASYFATWLVVAVFLGPALAAMETGVAWRSVAWSSMALSLVAMFLNGTRAALLGLAAGAAVWIWGRGFHRGRRLVAATAALALAAAAFYVSPAGLQLRSRTRWFVEDPWGGGRGPLWADALAMAGHKLLFGFGPEVFTAAFPAYESARLARLYPDFSYQSPHNMFLDALVAQGLPGLLAVGALCWIGFYAARRARHPAGLLLAAALAAGLISQQFTVLTVPTALLIFTVAAMTVSITDGRLLPSVSFRSDIPRRIVPAIAAAIFLFVAFRLATADAFLAFTRSHLETGRVSQAAADFASYDRWRLPGTSSDLWYSRACARAMQANNIDTVSRFLALAQYGFAAVRATATAEEPFDAWYNASQYYALRNDAAAMERSLRSAVAARPNWFKPHWALAQLLRLENRLPEADREAALAVYLDAGAHAEVVNSYQEIHRLAANASGPLHK